jgi:hypothetical protein
MKCWPRLPADATTVQIDAALLAAAAGLIATATGISISSVRRGKPIRIKAYNI